MSEVSVPYIVYEGEMARQERHSKRLIVILIITLIMLFGSNMAWLYVWNQYEYVDETQTIEAVQDGDRRPCGGHPHDPVQRRQDRLPGGMQPGGPAEGPAGGKRRSDRVILSLCLWDAYPSGDCLKRGSRLVFLNTKSDI